MTNHKDLVRLIKKQVMNIILFPLRVLPIRNNRIILVNGLSFKNAGNPKAILEHLNENFSNMYEIFLAVDDVKKNADLLEKGVVPVKYCSFKYYKYALTSKVFITNSGGYSFLPIRKKQCVINTWHGGGAYKKGGLDVCKNTPAYVKDVKMTAKRTSLFLTTCKEQTEIFARSYLIPKDRILEIGMPRNDIFFNADEELRIKIKREIGLMDSEKLVLYAPTFRVKNDDQLADTIVGDYDIDVNGVCKSLSERFGSSWRFAYRLHPTIAQRNLPQFDNAINLSNYVDMQDLLLAADVLINDYSSSMWDFSFTNRPCFIFATDIEHYIKTTSFYTPMEEWPYPISSSNKQLREQILAFDEQDYLNKATKHKQKLGCFEKGNATEVISKKIYEVCFGK